MRLTLELFADGLEVDQVVCCVLCVVCCVLCVVCRVSCVVCRVSCVVCRVSCVVCRVSCVVCRVDEMFEWTVQTGSTLSISGQ